MMAVRSPESQEEVPEVGRERYVPPIVEVIGTVAALTMGKVSGPADQFGGSA